MRWSASRVRATVAVATLLAAASGLAAAGPDFGRFVALGDSFTAGFQDGGLAVDGQRAGFARRLALQARGAGAAFEQPEMTAPGIPALLEVRRGKSEVLVPKAGLGSPVNLTLPRPYDNLAVPGARAADLYRARTDRGGLRDLILRGLGTQLEQALVLEPSFVSVWVGASDVLPAAVSGVVLDGVTLTPVSEFEAYYESVVQTLVAGGVTRGVVATVPDVTGLPFVSGRSRLAGDGRTARLGPEGPLEAGDRVLWTATPLMARGDGLSRSLGGSGRPLPDYAILDRKEVRQVRGRIADYNRIIRRVAADVGFAVVESEPLFEELSEISAARHFSSDGVHPSAHGHARIANAFIEAINRTYGGSIPTIDLAAESLLTGPAGPNQEPVFSRRAYRTLRFALGIPTRGRLLAMKARALERLERQRRRRLERFRNYELPPPPKLAQGRQGAAIAL